MTAPVFEPHVIDRFVGRIRISPNTGCWEWCGALNNKGYGKIKVKGRTFAIHRFSYEIFVGRIPADLTLDHLCRVRHCVNPAHLEPVTIGENVLRGLTRAAANLAKTQCVNGHPFDEQNTVYRRTGGRKCRACAREYYHRRGKYLRGGDVSGSASVRAASA